MTKDIFKERERGFEAGYFQKEDAKLIRKIRERAALDELAAALAEKLAVTDPALLQRLADLGVTRGTGAAVLMLPLVQVAWADGSVSPREREVVLEMAAERGVAAGTPAHDQLLAWLTMRPSDELFDAAVDVVRAGFAVLPPAERDERAGDVLDGCARVAEASGVLSTVLGLATGVSAEEAAVLAELRRRFGLPGSRP